MINKSLIKKKLNSEKGITGVDIVVAVTMIALTISVVMSIFINTNNTARKVTRTSGATRMATNIYSTSYPENPPEWYWISGLHDACIIGTESFEFPFDYHKFIGEKNKYNRNLITLRINAKGALYDNDVKEIRLFNYRILTEDISLEGRDKVWWLADRLVDHGNYYTLEIDLQDFDAYPEEFTFKIKFERAEVDR